MIKPLVTPSDNLKSQALNAKVSDIFPWTPELEKEAVKFLNLAKSARHVLISSTLTSDGDSIGSQIGVAYLINKLSAGAAKIRIVNESPVPKRYSFLLGTDKILTMKDWQKAKEKPAFDLGIVTDGGVERSGVVAPLFEDISNVVLVDHHAIGGSRSYASKLLDLDSSSTCELVYHLFEFAGVEVPPEIAEHLFLGIVFDTGFFKHSITTPRTHHVAAKLIATGIDFSKISDRAILERSWAAQQLLRALLANMKLEKGGQIIHSSWSAKELKALKTKDGDQEGMINQLYFTEGTEVVALFTEKSKNDIKISFRSKGKLNVAEFARSIDPNGGGHIRAAGCSMKGNLAAVKKKVIAALTKALKKA